MDNKINPYITYALKRPLPLNQKKPNNNNKIYNITDQCNDEQKIKSKYITDLL